jgi:hypothetical protein
MLKVTPYKISTITYTGKLSDLGENGRIDMVKL